MAIAAHYCHTKIVSFENMSRKLLIPTGQNRVVASGHNCRVHTEIFFKGRTFDNCLMHVLN